MFGEDLFRSFFRDPFFESAFGFGSNQTNDAFVNRRPRINERCSLPKPRDLFNEFSRAADEIFEAATRSILLPRRMYSRYNNSTWRGSVEHPSRTYGVSLNGDLVERNNNGTNTRPYRHLPVEPVTYNRTRLQWYDSNTRRTTAPGPSPPRLMPSGRLSTAELARLPLSTYRIRPGEHEPANSDSSPIPVVNNNSSIANISPGAAYLQPVARAPTLVEIQPLQSSPSRGQPECEVCLTEYRNKDKLRHLPCGHAFHAKCIDVWFTQSSTCPKCRAGVRTGLRRLERNRPRGVSSSQPGAPVRAIRPRPSSKSATRTRTANSASRSRSRAGNQQNTTRSTQPTSHETEDHQADPGSGVLPQIQADVTRAEIVRQLVEQLSVAVDDVTSLSRTLTRISPNVDNTEPSNSSGTVRPPSSSDLSAVVRRKAAEAAIRRAEQAARERAQEAEQVARS